ncbi:hypothetical protein [Falsiporphyromonas endometrii]|uniref:Uncharacterized protein n=1 Tax=Falsiporphyromonas endometrii TaxID=1387297 RepID=A0ABV9K742_9PORP
MEISILLTILLIIISLGGSFLQEGKICLVNEEQINDSVTIKYDLRNSLSHWAVKLVLRDLYLLNTVTLVVDQKATQSTSIQLQNLKFEG